MTPIPQPDAALPAEIRAAIDQLAFEMFPAVCQSDIDQAQDWFLAFGEECAILALAHGQQEAQGLIARPTKGRLPLEICDGHEGGSSPLSCINCARQLGRQEAREQIAEAWRPLEEECRCSTYPPSDSLVDAMSLAVAVAKEGTER